MYALDIESFDLYFSLKIISDGLKMRICYIG